MFYGMAGLVNKIIRRLFSKRKSGNEILGQEEEILLHTIQEYSRIISQYIPYFNTLSSSEKQRFIKRTWYFRSCKVFHYIGLEEKEEIAILVSAAAVQLTFGLRRYKLSYFKHIYIMPDAYQFEKPGDLYIGHVSPKGIYLSWKHFLQGYENGADNVNVAIHEMAHALEYNNFIDHAEADPKFRADFQLFPVVYGPALAHMITTRRSYLRSYAYTNIREFWAVSVETFFENPAVLKSTMPKLYYVICEILKQDPLSQHRNTTIV
jgi:Mlc titration factor MtfA (ptsG expression regulator)